MYIIFGYGPMDMLTVLGTEDTKSEAILSTENLRDYSEVHQCARLYWAHEHELSVEEVDAFELFLESFE